MEHQLTAASFRLFSYEFLKAYIITMRPYLLFISGITGIVGVSLNPGLNMTQSILIFLVSFLAYGFGQALTDCYQIDTDTLSSPYRPLTRGTVSRSHVLFISICGLICCITIFSIYNPVNLFLGILTGYGLYSYTYFKKRWWGGPLYNAWIVACLCFMAYLCGNTQGMFSQINLLFFLNLKINFHNYNQIRSRFAYQRLLLPRFPPAV